MFGRKARFIKQLKAAVLDRERTITHVGQAFLDSGGTKYEVAVVRDTGTGSMTSAKPFKDKEAALLQFHIEVQRAQIAGKNHDVTSVVLAAKEWRDWHTWRRPEEVAVT